MMSSTDRGFSVEESGFTVNESPRAPSFCVVLPPEAPSTLISNESGRACTSPASKAVASAARGLVWMCLEKSM